MSMHADMKLRTVNQLYQRFCDHLCATNKVEFSNIKRHVQQIIQNAFHLISSVQNYSACTFIDNTVRICEVSRAIHCVFQCVSLLARVCHLSSLERDETHQWHPSTIDIVCDVTNRACHDLIVTVDLKAQSHIKQYGDTDESGQFLLCCDQLLEILDSQLSPECCGMSSKKEEQGTTANEDWQLPRKLAAPLEVFVAHLMAVSRCCDLPSDQRCLSRLSQQVFDVFHQLVAEDNWRSQCGTLTAKCQQLRDKIELAEHVANTVLLRQIVRTFSANDCCCWLQQPVLTSSVSDKKHNEGNINATVHRLTKARNCTEPMLGLPAIIARGASSMDRLFDLCLLAVACSMDEKQVTSIAALLRVLALLETQARKAIRPEATEACALGERHNANEALVLSDHRNSQLIADLSAIWRYVVNLIRRSLDAVVDPGAFMHVVECEIAALIDSLRKSPAASVGDQAAWRSAVRQAVQLTARVVDFASNQLISEVRDASVEQLRVLAVNLQTAGDFVVRAVMTEAAATFNHEKTRDRVVRCLCAVVTCLRNIRSHLESMVAPPPTAKSRTSVANVGAAWRHLTAYEKTAGDVQLSTVATSMTPTDIIDATGGVSLDVSRYLNCSTVRFSRRRCTRVALDFSPLFQSGISSHC